LIVARGRVSVILWQRVLIGLLLGIAFGLLCPGAAPAIAFIGELFVRLIRMLVVPVVLITIAAGITSLGDPARLGSLGARTLGLFLATTFIAVAIGMGVALILRPGEGIVLAGAAAQSLGEAKTLHDQLIGIVPTNIFDSLAKGEMLPVILFSILVGVGVVLAREEGQPLARFLASASAVLLRIVRLVMELTPFGVFALVANAVAANGLQVFAHIGWLALAVLIGSVLQMVLVHLPLVRIAAGIGPRRFLGGIVDALAIAFSTASSSATMPVAMRCAEDNLGVSRVVSSTVLPLGAAIGKDGTAMYVGLISLFSLQAFGIAPTPVILGTVWLTGALAAFGTAPVPSASLFMLAAVLSAVGVPAEQTALMVGFILPFDRLLDMTRTVPSASANIAVATSVAAWEGELDPARARRPARE
jgi:Na+/H+-dicarboxylate symporter